MWRLFRNETASLFTVKALFLNILIVGLTIELVSQIPIENNSFEGMHMRGWEGVCYDTLIESWNICQIPNSVYVYRDTIGLSCSNNSILPDSGVNTIHYLGLNVTPQNEGSVSQKLMCLLNKGREYKFGFYATSMYTNFSGNNYSKSIIWLSNDSCGSSQEIYRSDTLHVGWQKHEFSFKPNNDYNYLCLSGLPTNPLNNLIGYDELSPIYPLNAFNVSITGSSKDTLITKGNCITLNSTPKINTYDTVYWQDAAGNKIADGFNGGTVCPDTSTYYIIAMRDSVQDCAGVWWSYDTVKVTVNTGTAVAPLSTGEGLGVRLYPNPATNTLNIQLTTQPLTLTTQLSYSIQNTLGQTLLTAPINDQQMFIDISNLPKGIYIFTLLENNKILKYEKLVKQ